MHARTLVPWAQMWLWPAGLRATNSEVPFMGKCYQENVKIGCRERAWQRCCLHDPAPPPTPPLRAQRPLVGTSGKGPDACSLALLLSFQSSTSSPPGGWPSTGWLTSTSGVKKKVGGGRGNLTPAPPHSTEIYKQKWSPCH